MAAKKRYIIGSASGPSLDATTRRELDAFLAVHPDVVPLKRTPAGRQLFELSETDRRALAAAVPRLIIEEDQDLQLFPMPSLPRLVADDGAFARQVAVADSSSGRPVPNATIIGVGDGASYRAVTDDAGRATLHAHEPVLRYVIASPLDSYWSQLRHRVAMDRSQTIAFNLRRLAPAPDGRGWGQRVMGFGGVHPYWTGRGVSIGLVDSGVTDQHGDLSPAGGVNTLDGQDSRAWNVDERGHGTHCGGVVAALNSGAGVLGGAPGARVYAIKVFPGGSLIDLVEGIEWCIRHRMDVISLSLGSHTPSDILRHVLVDAYQRGITCVAAVGNDRAQVAFPAAFPTVIGVSAIGRFGTFPEDSAHTLRVGGVLDWQGELFAASFNNAGPEVQVCAPGVAVLSTVPSGYAAWDGTSMACPLISALVALILEAHPWIRTGDARQPEYVRAVLGQSSIDLGMPILLQGAGLPIATRALFARAVSSPARAWV